MKNRAGYVDLDQVELSNFWFTVTWNKPIEPNRDLLGLKFIHTEICAVDVFNRRLTLFLQIFLEVHETYMVLWGII